MAGKEAGTKGNLRTETRSRGKGWSNFVSWASRDSDVYLRMEADVAIYSRLNFGEQEVNIVEKVQTIPNV